jgi:hypothetical protein
MGEVYRVHNSRVKRKVAIRLLPQTPLLDVERFCRFALFVPESHEILLEGS